jgi:hypothetical protein
MSEGDCVCIRYIDDFIILAPTAIAAKARMCLAKNILAEFDMTLSEEKSTTTPLRISDKFDWLGIEFNNGFIRPSVKAIAKLELNVKKRLDESARGMRETKPGNPVARKHSLIATLSRTDSIVRGWGKHYRFCNDEELFSRIDTKIAGLVGAFIGDYRHIKRRRESSDAASLLGIDELGRQQRKALIWPMKSR